MAMWKTSVWISSLVAGVLTLGPSSLLAQTETFCLTGNLNAPRFQHTATRLASGKVLVAGGIAGGLAVASAELYDPATGTWSPTGSMNAARVDHTGTLLPSGKVLVVGGQGEGGVRLASAELYDPATGTWSNTGLMSTPRVGHTATLLPSGEVLVAAGRPAAQFAVTASAELYDPTTGAFTLTGSLNQARRGHVAALLASGKVFVTDGGDGNSVFRSSELYDPATETWTFTGSRVHPVDSEAVRVAQLADGRVLLAGGEGTAGQNPVTSAELYDPVAGTFSVTGSLTVSRTSLTLTLLNNGNVLAVGGVGGNPPGTPFPRDELASAELYDPSTESWSPTASMNVARYVHTAILLNSGEVLVAGGFDGATALASAEVYTVGPCVFQGQFFLHGSGGTANPPVLFLDAVAPTATTAKYKDSTAVVFGGGNPWKQIGTWPADPSLTDGELAALSDLHVWVGLKNSDDIGTQFDLRAEVYKNAMLVALGETRCITGITRNPALAKEVRVPGDVFSPVVFDGTTDVLSLRVLTRIGTNPDGTKCSGPGGSHSSAVGLRLYFDAVSRNSGFDALAP